MLSFECIKNEKSVYFLLTSAISFTTRLFLGIFITIMSSATQFPLK